MGRCFFCCVGKVREEAGIRHRAGSETQASDIADAGLPRVLLDGEMLDSLRKAEAGAVCCYGWFDASCSKDAQTSAPTNLEKLGQEAEGQRADAGHCLGWLGCTRAAGWLWLGLTLCWLYAGK